MKPNRINDLQTWFTSLCAQKFRNNRRARFSGRDIWIMEDSSIESKSYPGNLERVFRDKCACTLIIC